MKNFVKENWYKLMIGSSMMMASFGFMIYAVSPAYSNSEKTEINNRAISNNQKVIQVPINEDGSVNVKLSEEQMKELKSKPMDNIGGKYYIGTGNGIYYTTNSNPCIQGDWKKIPLQ